jgi:chitin disaccharide deacetylase
MRKGLIVTADDYGMYKSVNQAIEECIDAGSLFATCAMPNMHEFGDVVRLRKRFPEHSLGLHWNIIDGKPILPPAKVPSLIGSSGDFHVFYRLRRLWIQRRISVADLEAELKAQYRRYRESVGHPDFWNTHQNFHLLPGLFQICLRIAQEFGISSTRCHNRLAIASRREFVYGNLNHPLGWIKGKIIARWSRSAQRIGMLMPSGIVNMNGFEIVPESYARLSSHLDWSRIQQPAELVIHPATSSQEALFTTGAERRIVEYKIFRNPKFADQLRRADLILMGYNGLKN